MYIKLLSSSTGSLFKADITYKGHFYMIVQTFKEQDFLSLPQAADKCEFGGKLKDFYRMVRSNALIIQKYPQLICQQALNEPDSSSCSSYAKDYLIIHGKNSKFIAFILEKY